jgi:hypothetical protein
MTIGNGSTHVRQVVISAWNRLLFPTPVIMTKSLCHTLERRSTRAAGSVIAFSPVQPTRVFGRNWPRGYVRRTSILLVLPCPRPSARRELGQRYPIARPRQRAPALSQAPSRRHRPAPPQAAVHRSPAPRSNRPANRPRHHESRTLDALSGAWAEPSTVRFVAVSCRCVCGELGSIPTFGTTRKHGRLRELAD